MKKIIILISAIMLLNSALKSQSLYFPPVIGNVWDSILPSNLNYCQARIDSLYNYLQTKNTKSLIILKNGKRVLEKYFGNYTRDSLWYWASASKSLASFITGMAQQKGYININNKVSQYIGAGWTNEPLVKENMITVRHLLKMNSGLDDLPPLPCNNEDTAKSCLVYLTDTATRWAYHTGAYKKIQDVVSNAVGQTYNAITNNWIEAKTGMSGIWFQQIYYSKARDMARFGLLNLNKGIWNTDTLMKDTAYYKSMINTSQNLNKAYGYLWWLNGKNSFMTPQIQFTFSGPLMSNAPSDMFCALGKNDQKIYVVPSQNLVVVRQGNSAGGFNLAASAFDNVLWDYINKLDCSATSIQDKGTKIYSVYPNPVTNLLNIDNANSTLYKICVYDVFGKIVYVSTKFESKINIDFSYFVSGTYLVELHDEGKQVIRKLVIKE